MEKIQLTQSPDEKEPNNEIVKTADPNEFLQNFRDSDAYKEHMDEFYKGKDLPDNLDSREKMETFEDGESGRRALIEYAHEGGHLLKYDPEYYSKEFGKHFAEYKDFMKDFMRGHIEGSNRELVVAIDHMRSIRHQAASNMLVRTGITKCNKIARGLIQLMMIEKGLETFDNAKISETDRLRWQLSGSQFL